MEPPEIALTTAADGLWTAEQRMEVIVWCEQLRLLRWTLGTDAELIPLAHRPVIDYALAHSLLQQRGFKEAGTPLRAPWELRGERDIAAGYLTRIFAELKARSLIDDDVEPKDLGDEFRKQSLGPSTDYLAGSKMIAELSEQPLRQLGMVALARARYAAYLVDLLSANEPLTFPEWSERKCT